jgi:NitT/TauT family transport system permease protein
MDGDTSPKAFDTLAVSSPDKAAEPVTEQAIGHTSRTLPVTVRRSLWKRWWNGPVVRPALGVLLLLALWQAIVSLFDVPRFLFIGPIEAIEQFYLLPGYYWNHILVTLQESLLGFAGGAIAGILCGVLVYYIPPIQHLLYPSLIAINTIPKVALAPLFVVWFGYSTTSKSIVALTIAFFPVLVATVDGLTAVPAELRELARINRASTWQRMRKIDMIYCMPWIITGMKISISMAVGGAVVGEFIAGRSGLGYIIVVANSQVNLAAMFAAFVALAVIAQLLFSAVGVLGKLLVPWAQHGGNG